MPFWRGKVETKDARPGPRRLRNILIKQIGDRLVARFSTSDGNWFDIETNVVRFDLGEELSYTMIDHIDVETTQTEK